MTPFSGQLLDTQLTSIRSSIAAIIELCSAQGYGIVSSVLECETPTTMAVSFDGQHVTVSPGDFVTPGGQVGNMPGSITDMLWPDAPVLYVAVYSETHVNSAVDVYGLATWSTAVPTVFLSLLTDAQLASYPGANVTVIAVLSQVEGGRYVDQTQLNNSLNRSTWSLEDALHRSLVNQAARRNNAHGIGLNQVSSGNYTVLAQVLDTGYVSSDTETAPGVAGTYVTKSFTTEAIPDSVGRIVAPGHFYITLPGTPTVPPIIPGVQFTWEPGTRVVDFGLSDHGAVTVSWFDAPGCDVVSGLLTASVTFADQGEATIVSDGQVPVFYGDTFDVSKFDGIPSIIDVYVGGDAKLVCAPDVIDTVTPAVSTAPTATMPAVLDYPSQIGFRVRKSNVAGSVPPPLGNIEVLSTACYGRYNFMFTVDVPGDTEEVQLVGTDFGSYSAQTDVWKPDQLTIAGTTIPKDYWTIRDSRVYLESRAYKAGVAKLERGKFESQRFRAGSTTVVGTNEAPSGTKAFATIVIRGSLTAGDSVSVLVSPENPVITKSVTGPTGNTADAAAWLATALNADPLFSDFCTASATASTVVLTAKTPGDGGNSYILSVSMADASTKVKVTGFKGGGPYTSQPTDIVGAGIRIHMLQAWLPNLTSVKVYATGNLDSGGVETSYKQVGMIPVVPGMFSYDFYVQASDVTSFTDTYDVATKFQASIQITGVDPLGSNLVETVTLDDSNICESQTPDGDASIVYSTNVYSKITNYMVTSSANTANTEIVLLSSALSRNSSRARIARITTDGTLITKIIDTRLLQPERFVQTHEFQTDGITGSIALKGI